MTTRANRPADLDHVRVTDCMHAGILTCPQGTPIGDVAALMATHHVHAIAVTNGPGGRPEAIISALDVVSAIAAGSDPAAAVTATAEPLKVSSASSLKRAAALMAENGASHLVVVDAASGYPVGVISTLDIAAAYSGGQKA